MKDMLSTKLKSVLIVSSILGGFFLLLELRTGLPIYFIFVMVYAFIGNVVYGIPVSFLSDFVTMKIGKNRFIFASLFYLVFGFLPSIFLGDLGIYAVICSLLFFLSEEWQRMRKYNRGIKPANKVMITNTLSTVILFSLALYGSMTVSGPLFEKHTNEVYLIPKGYEGEVRVVYNIKDAPKPKKSEDFDIYRMNEKGYTLSPLPEREGIINNQYFYIDKEGNKERIDDSCINLGGSEGVQIDDYEYSSTYFTVTNTHCSESFSTDGDPDLPRGISLEGIIKEEGLDKPKN
ncbi:DUF6843 domain-containing protein [Peribacillus aracenensis]|uniref:DUF6843 domain-containing protein n=1 Tax=Peribacillus aracenensis TaxID=2976708 RepID=UPI0021A834E5|nr:hypothetical protein [Peribacillus sp. BBB004]